ERTKQTVVELEQFLAQQFEQAVSACEQAISNTESDCAQTMQTAQSVANTALEMTTNSADALRSETSEAMARIQQDFKRQLGFTQRTFEHNLAQCEAEITQVIDQLVERATARAASITAEVDQVHSEVEASLADARTVLAPDYRKAA